MHNMLDSNRLVGHSFLARYGRKEKITRRVTIEFQGEQVEGEEVGWEVLKGEDWAEYRLEDGTVLKARNIVAKVVRLNKRKPDGEPIYAVSWQQMMTTHVQPHLMERS